MRAGGKDDRATVLANASHTRWLGAMGTARPEEENPSERSRCGRVRLPYKVSIKILSLMFSGRCGCLMLTNLSLIFFPHTLLD